MSCPNCTAAIFHKEQIQNNHRQTTEFVAWLHCAKFLTLLPSNKYRQLFPLKLLLTPSRTVRCTNQQQQAHVSCNDHRMTPGSGFDEGSATTLSFPNWDRTTALLLPDWVHYRVAQVRRHNFSWYWNRGRRYCFAEPTIGLHLLCSFSCVPGRERE